MINWFKKNKLGINKFCVYLALHVFTAALIASIFLLAPTHNESFPHLRVVIIFFASILLAKYFIYMFISPWNDVYIAYKKRKSRTNKTIDRYEPFVSVLVPAWNEEVGIITTVEALLKSTYKNMEIVVINNASTDNTEKNVLALIKKYNALPAQKRKIELVYCLESAQGKGHALNTGIKKAKGDIIVSIDADCFVDSRAVYNFVQHFRDPKVMAAVGNVKVGNTDTIIGTIQYLEFLFSFYFKKGDSLANTIYIIGGAAGAFRKEVFETIGNYSASNITEDIELSVRIQAAGMKIVYAADALVYTEGAVCLNGLMKQRLRWKRGRFETFAEHKDMFFSTNPKHNKMLSWIVLPLAIFGEIQLALELLFLIFLYVFSFLTNDYSSFISGIIVVSSMFFIQVAFDGKVKNKLRFFLLAPIGWLLFYVSTFVEFNALFKALWGYYRKNEITWQKWERNGVFTDKLALKSQ